MDKRKRKSFIGKVLVALLLLSTLITTSILAEGEKEDTESTANGATGTVTFKLPEGFDKDEAKDFEESGEGELVVGLLKVADIIWNGSKGQFEFVSEEYGDILENHFAKGDEGYVIDADDADVIKDMSAAAQEIANSVSEFSLEPDEIQLGRATDVPEGLYLVVPHNLGRDDFITTVTDGDGNEVIVSYAYTTANEYDFTMNLLPVSAAQTVIYGSMEDVILKPESQPRMGRAIIKKSLANFYTTGTFVFKITAVFEGKTIFNDVRSLTFTAAGELTIEDLPDFPVGTEVTVEEVYSGASYKLVEGSENPQTIEIKEAYVENAEEPVVYAFEFENEFSDTPNHGYGIDNSFEYDEENGWSWSVTKSTGGDR